MTNTYTNVSEHGGEFISKIQNELASATDATIVSGYVSLDIVEHFSNDLLRIARANSKAQLLVGMAFYEGLPQKKLDSLMDLSQKLNGIQEDSGVFVCHSRKFHGKVYSFNRNSDRQSLYVGSSNFSRSGLSQNIETTVKINEPETIGSTLSFLDFLMSPDNVTLINKADIVSRGSGAYRERLRLSYLSDLRRYDVESVRSRIDTTPSFKFDLREASMNEKSNLNVYFGKGRWSRSTGKIRPRPWYEVELIAKRDLNSLDEYPKGEFLAYTDDGYILPMKTSGDNYKNIRSKHSLQLLGQWIKGKLQESGALIPLTPVTEDTLDEYGKDHIAFYKISEGEYYVEF